ncbi:MAG: glycosyltransferase, partial [Chamaesiphon sp.]|nr:glycosyltransferase [Chamaesiphon sp.]
MTDNQTSLLSIDTIGSLVICDRQSIPYSAKKFPELSLVIPTFNEGQNIKQIVSILVELLDRIIPEDYELIVVDDDSPDRTWELARELIATYPQLRVIRRQTERGLSTAVIRGWQAARGEILGVIDADLQHPPEILLRLWAEMNQGAELAVASRNITGGAVSESRLVRR